MTRPATQSPRFASILKSGPTLWMVAAMACGLRGLAATQEIQADFDTIITEHPVLGGPDSNGATVNGLHVIGLTPYDSFALYHFDFASLAGKTVVADAVLRLGVVDGAPEADGYARQISIWNVAIPWDLGTVTYNLFGADPGVQFGQDTGASPLSIEAVEWPGAGQRYISFVLPAALMQSWIDNPAGNHGILVSAPPTPFASDLTFASLEAGFLTPGITLSTAELPESSDAVQTGGIAVLLLATVHAVRARRSRDRGD